MNNSTRICADYCAILILCVLCLCLVISVGLPSFPEISSRQRCPCLETPFNLNEATPTPFVDPSSQILDPTEYEKAFQTLNELKTSMVPINDPIDLAARLGGKPNVPNVLIDTEAPYSVGDQKTFGNQHGHK